MLKTNKDFYKYIEGNYNSYWMGKFVNRFIESGKLQVVEKEFNKVYYFAKLNSKLSILPVLLQAVEKSRPTFVLKSRKVGSKSKEFPAFINQNKQRSIAIKNLKKICEGRKEWYLNQRILNEFLSLLTLRNHQLIKDRNESIKQAALNRFNIRFSFRKKR